jgi:hypothetical protein
MRTLVKSIHNQKDLERAFYLALATSEYKTLTIVALKALAVTHKLYLYCPFLEPKSLRSFYEKVANSWKEILKNKIRNSNDSFRCEYFGKLICSYAFYLDSKCAMAVEYNNYIDGGFSLNNYFVHNSGKSPL